MKSFLLITLLTIGAFNSYSRNTNADTTGFDITQLPVSLAEKTSFITSEKEPRDIMYPYVTMDLSLGASTASIERISSTPFKSAKPNFSVGAGIGIVLRDGKVGRSQVGLYYQMAGLSTKPSGMDNNKLQLHYFKLPLQYQAYLDKEKRFFAGGGGYGALLIGKKQTGSSVFVLDNIGKSDAGIVVSGGCWLSASWLVELNIHWGLVDIDNSQGTSVASNRIFFFKFSYVPSPWKQIKSVFER